MFRFPLRSALVMAALSGPALGQTAMPAQEPPPKLATELPAPPLSDDARPGEFLQAAARAVATGRKGEAQQSLEMAQTRLLDRSVPLGATGVPSEQPAVKLISQALQALAAGDRGTCLRLIEEARLAIRQN